MHACKYSIIGSWIQQETLKGINGGCNVPNAKNNTLMASAAPAATTAKKVNISKLTSNLDLCTPCTPTPISSTPTAIIATPPTPLPLPLPLPLSASVVATAQIKKKTSSFLHRDYNRKPILARSQVSKIFCRCFYLVEDLKEIHADSSSSCDCAWLFLRV